MRFLLVRDADWPSSGGGGGAPSGPAGGVLGGSYPNPGFAVDMATQAELDAVAAAAQPLDSDLTAIAALSTTSFGRSLLAAANAAALRTLAGTMIGTDVQAFDSDLASIAALATTSFGRSVLTQADAAALRTLAGLVIGMDVQAQDSDLAAIAALATTSFGRSLLTLADSAALRDAAAAQPKARVVRAAALTIATATITAVTWDNPAIVDTATFFNNGNPTRLTAPSTARYLVTSQICWTGGTGGTLRLSWVAKNGGSFRYGFETKFPNALNQQISNSFQIDLTAGDYLELNVYQDKGTNLDLSTNGGLVNPADLQIELVP